MNEQIVGKCSKCGGLVFVKMVFEIDWVLERVWVVKEWLPKCFKCLRVAKKAWEPKELPTIEME